MKAANNNKMRNAMFYRYPAQDPRPSDHVLVKFYAKLWKARLRKLGTDVSTVKI